MVFTLYVISIPLKLGVFISIFIVALYKLLFTKVIGHFKTGNFNFDKKDFIVYLLLLIMTLFIVIIGLVLRSLLPYFV